MDTEDDFATVRTQETSDRAIFTTNRAQIVDEIADQREDFSLEQHIDRPVRREEQLNNIQEETVKDAALNR